MNNMDKSIRPGDSFGTIPAAVTLLITLLSESVVLLMKSRDLSPARSKTLLGIVVTCRIVLPALLFAFVTPFFAMVVNELVVDTVIGHVEESYHLSRIDWQKRVDKPLDLLGFTYSLYPVLTHPAFVGSRELMIALFLYRLIGVIIFVVTENRLFFIAFANFYVGAFYGISLAWTVGLPQFRVPLLLGGMALAWGREFYLHGKWV